MKKKGKNLNNEDVFQCPDDRYSYYVYKNGNGISLFDGKQIKVHKSKNYNLLELVEHTKLNRLFTIFYYERSLCYYLGGNNYLIPNNTFTDSTIKSFDSDYVGCLPPHIVILNDNLSDLIDFSCF